MQRTTQDAALKYAIGDEVKAMSDNMEAALKNNPKLLADWKAADRLWSRAYALDEVADAIRASTTGTPMTAQATGVRLLPEELHASTLVSRLNDLDHDGTLEKAFTSEQIRNLRESADVLDRIQRTSVGQGMGESISHRGVMHALRGERGPLIGGGLGGLFGAMTGGLHGAFYGGMTGASAGLAAQVLYENMLAKVMTTAEGVKALRAVNAAKTPTAMRLALNRLAEVAATGGAAQAQQSSRQQLQQLQAEAARRNPHNYPAAVSAAAP